MEERKTSPKSERSAVYFFPDKTKQHTAACAQQEGQEQEPEHQPEDEIPADDDLTGDLAAEKPAQGKQEKAPFSHSFAVLKENDLHDDTDEKTEPEKAEQKRIIRMEGDVEQTNFHGFKNRQTHRFTCLSVKKEMFGVILH